eukprot:CAMPEP_0167743616 /NCGR_PEP_ID=MMETSP0110_2-20121227/2114_1 /TAXON_ID=629695 /ORGANISM="Gymnochlora sp., Strain CCMP2014" /LENGTH=231 /DNA_ID=CAMNT_0007628005 /DNA_START=529 /DNA_END=1221 /DNA_ORIENTATION=-
MRTNDFTWSAGRCLEILKKVAPNVGSISKNFSCICSLASRANWGSFMISRKFSSVMFGRGSISVETEASARFISDSFFGVLSGSLLVILLCRLIEGLRMGIFLASLSDVFTGVRSDAFIGDDFNVAGILETDSEVGTLTLDEDTFVEHVVVVAFVSITLFDPFRLHGNCQKFNVFHLGFFVGVLLEVFAGFADVGFFGTACTFIRRCRRWGLFTGPIGLGSAEGSLLFPVW